ncbi:MAG: alpha-E domain-containing protein [Pseudomonadota bacterium]
MLGRTAGGLFWMFRYLERAENTARLLDMGFRIALTRPDNAADEWSSVLETAGIRAAYDHKYDSYEQDRVVDFMLRDKDNSSSALAATTAARTNARMVRTALTREAWEAVNECWMAVRKSIHGRISDRDLPDVLRLIRQQNALVRGALHGSMLRNDIYDFSRLGTFIERADATARILDVKYYVLLPSTVPIGSSYDNVQWENVLLSVAGLRSYRHAKGSRINAKGVAEFVILDQRMPRSLAFCYNKIVDNLGYLERDYGVRLRCHKLAEATAQSFKNRTIESIIEDGLHENVLAFIRANTELALQIERDYRFME